MEEKECRVCRDIGNINHKLYAPCLCNGSILYCHQDCLEEWLKRSGKNKCELCGVIYNFQPKYSPSTPEVIPLKELIKGGIKTLYKKILPFCFRIILSIICWLGLVPFLTSFTYHIFMRPDENIFKLSYYNFFLYFINYNIILKNITSGILLTGLIVLAFIVTVIFYYTYLFYYLFILFNILF